MPKNENKSSIDWFISSECYRKASRSAFPDNKCRDCSLLFTFKNKTRCYAYEQQGRKDKGVEFSPRRDFNCDMFDTTGLCAIEIHYYLQALKKGIDPHDDAEYIEALNDAPAGAIIGKQDGQSSLGSDGKKDWDDPNTYANCSDWEDAPGNCMHCADDECPMNKS